MHCILVSMGSMGDTLPFVALGLRMQARGHRVTLVANAHFREFIAQQGLAFSQSLSAEQYQSFLHLQTVSSHTRALKEMGEFIIGVMPTVYRTVCDLYERGNTVVASQGYGFGARLAHETHGVPLATVHLQPMWFRSIYDPPGLPEWIPRWFPQGIDNLIDFALDRGIGKRTNAYRAELGLPPVKKVMKQWWNSPQLVLGLFADWYNPPQADWPPNSYLPGFPLLTVGNQSFDSRELDEFLAQGKAPIVFTQSSVTLDAVEFFRVSVQAAQILGRRAVLLTPHGEQIPRPLPDSVRHFSYVPLERLLPRSALHVHHGGIGTIAHTLAAGIPQLTVPMVYDQPDNAQRLLRLGVSDYLSKRGYKTRKVVRKLSALLDSRQVADKCRFYQTKMQASDALENACDALEKLKGTDRAGRAA